MKFSDRTAAERVAIDAWIRVAIHAREEAYMPIADGFRQSRENTISENPAEVAKMLGYYATYQAGRHKVSYADYFQVSNPEAYAAILTSEKEH